MERTARNKTKRPGKETRYVKEVRVRYRLTWELETSQIEEDEITDGVFPLVTNQHEMPAAEVLKAYKRQPLIEKRFSQFQSDFEGVPVYLKEVTRIQSLPCIYFFALMVQTLLERELRGTLESSGYDTIPLYPEHRDCSAPTTRRILDIFNNVQRHTLSGGTAEPKMFVTQLSPLQRWIASGVDLSSRKYGRCPACSPPGNSTIIESSCAESTFQLSYVVQNFSK